MASKSITELDAIQLSQISSNDSFVLEHSNNAMRMTAQTFLAWAADELDGHGGIQSVEKTSTEGLEDTYTITFGDGTTTSFIVKNGAKGDKGDTGETGETGSPAVLESSAVAYQKSDNGTTPPTGTWSSTIPEIVSGEFLWTRTTLTFNSGSPVVFYSVSSAGQDGSGTGTVTSVAVETGSNSGLTVTGSPITSNGTIRINHKHTVTENNNVALRPFSMDGTGHITAYLGDVHPCRTYDAYLYASNWDSSGHQTVLAPGIKKNGFVHMIRPKPNHEAKFHSAGIYVVSATQDNYLDFVAVGTIPTTDINVTVFQFEVI